MREILELCVHLDGVAEKTYRDLAEHCPDHDVARTFRIMSDEEHMHVGWWTELLAAWEDGLVPDIVDQADPMSRLRELGEDVTRIIPEDFSAMDTDSMLNIAAHLEFYMLDPVFGELMSLTGPGSSEVHTEAYRHHVMRLVDAIEKRYSRDELSHFLARMLTRSFRDQQRLAELATRDSLTGLLNRRGLFSAAKQWAAWSARYGHPLSVIVVDVDRFKTVNDRYGHPAGDAALVHIANALTRAVRASDIVGRYGGDEFLVVAPETDAEELRALMQRLLDTVRASQVRLDGEPVPVTVSVGGSWTDGGVTATADQLLAAADRSLYSAKEMGRDRAGDASHAATR